MTGFLASIKNTQEAELILSEKIDIVDFKKVGDGALGYVGEKIINHLIKEAKKLDIIKLSVETGAGNFFSPARKLFKKFGFIECQPFAHYKVDPNSCYYTLEL